MLRSASSSGGSTRFATRLTLVVLTLLVAGCTSDDDQPAEPGPGQLRYAPVEAALCDSMDLAGVLQQANLTPAAGQFQGPTASPTPDERGFRYWGICEFSTAAGDRPYLSRAEVGVVVTENPDQVTDFHTYWVDEVERVISEQTDEPGLWGDVAPVETDGWWTGGNFANYAPEPQVVAIDYHVFHENVLVWSQFDLDYDPDRFDSAAVVEAGHELAKLLIDAAIRVVPCEVDEGVAPPTHCDTQD
ncbi:MAG TPA: hypothetical protein VIL37_12920 [Natronosporangium sp.]